jgi:ketosteroid isomerase-like protein
LNIYCGEILEHVQSSEAILKTALNLDKAIENRKFESVLSKFSEDCEVELLGVKLSGKDGVKKWMEWQFKHIAKVEFAPVTKMVSGNIFFEEFMVKAKLHDGEEIRSKQAVVLQFKGSLITNLRLYFDRLDFADSVAKDVVSKTIVKELVKKSIEGLA